MKRGDLEVRGFRAGDEIILADEGRGPGERGLDEWAWKYPSFPDPRPLVVADCGGAVEGWCGGRRVDLWDGRTTRPAAIVMDLEVAPERAGPNDLQRSLLQRFVADMASEDRMVLAGAGVLGQLATRSISSEVVTLRRDRTGRASPSRLLYRAELGRDWEPRLDALWRPGSSRFGAALVRDAEHALRWFAGHPRTRWHRFVILPRFGRSAAAWVVFGLRDGVCRWVDLVWDSHHPGALVLAAHLSAGVAGQFDAAAEEVVVGGDPEAVRRLERLGFSRRATSEAVMEVADPAAVSGARALSEMYLTATDVELLAAEALI